MFTTAYDEARNQFDIGYRVQQQVRLAAWGSGVSHTRACPQYYDILEMSEDARRHDCLTRIMDSTVFWFNRKWRRVKRIALLAGGPRSTARTDRIKLLHDQQ